MRPVFLAVMIFLCLAPAAGRAQMALPGAVAAPTPVGQAGAPPVAAPPGRPSRRRRLRRPGGGGPPFHPGEAAHGGGRDRQAPRPVRFARRRDGRKIRRRSAAVASDPGRRQDFPAQSGLRSHDGRRRAIEAEAAGRARRRVALRTRLHRLPAAIRFSQRRLARDKPFGVLLLLAGRLPRRWRRPVGTARQQFRRGRGQDDRTRTRHGGKKRPRAFSQPAGAPQEGQAGDPGGGQGTGGLFVAARADLPRLRPRRRARLLRPAPDRGPRFPAADAAGGGE